jgi:tRNA-binding protein
MLISWEDFEKLEIRVGTITEVSDFPKAKKPAYRLTVDFGEFGIRKSSAQITRFYDRDQLVGMQVTAVLNFPNKKIADFVSECLVLGVYADPGSVVLLAPERKVFNGSRVG